MFCIFCGALNPNEASFCSSCGKAIGTSANPPVPTEIPQRVLGSTERSRDSSGQASQPMSLPAQPEPQAQYQPAAGKSKIALWILVGFAACLIIVMAVVLGFRQNQASSGQGTPSANSAPDTPPATAPVADNTPAPVSTPVQAPAPIPPAAPQNPLVGEWKTTTVIGSSIVLQFGADGRYTLKDLLTDEGVYVFSSGDGTLRLQSNSIFSKGIMVWSCQLSGDSFSCVDAAGAGHVYTRVQ